MFKQSRCYPGLSCGWIMEILDLLWPLRSIASQSSFTWMSPFSRGWFTTEQAMSHPQTCLPPLRPKNGGSKNDMTAPSQPQSANCWPCGPGHFAPAKKDAPKDFKIDQAAWPLVSAVSYGWDEPIWILANAFPCNPNKVLSSAAGPFQHRKVPAILFTRYHI